MGRDTARTVTGLVSRGRASSGPAWSAHETLPMILKYPGFCVTVSPPPRGTKADIREPARSAARIAWPARAAGLFSRMLRHPEFGIAALGTGLSAHDIAARMTAFKPPET